jgi:hypothetical protein
MWILLLVLCATLCTAQEVGGNPALSGEGVTQDIPLSTQPARDEMPPSHRDVEKDDQGRKSRPKRNNHTHPGEQHWAYERQHCGHCFDLDLGPFERAYTDLPPSAFIPKNFVFGQRVHCDYQSRLYVASGRDGRQLHYQLRSVRNRAFAHDCVVLPFLLLPDVEVLGDIPLVSSVAVDHALHNVTCGDPVEVPLTAQQICFKSWPRKDIRDNVIAGAAARIILEIGEVAEETVAHGGLHGSRAMQGVKLLQWRLSQGKDRGTYSLGRAARDHRSMVQWWHSGPEFPPPNVPVSAHQLDPHHNEHRRMLKMHRDLPLDHEDDVGDLNVHHRDTHFVDQPNSKEDL